jgi:hypothetical protein
MHACRLGSVGRSVVSNRSVPSPERGLILHNDEEVLVFPVSGFLAIFVSLFSLYFSPIAILIEKNSHRCAQSEAHGPPCFVAPNVGHLDMRGDLELEPPCG